VIESRQDVYLDSILISTC